MFFLTYPRVDDKDITLRGMFTWMLKLFDLIDNAPPVRVLIVCREEHADGTPHYHVFVQFIGRLVVNDANAFDYSFNDVEYHCNIQAARSARAVVKYLLKGGVYLSNVDDEIVQSLIRSQGNMTPL